MTFGRIERASLTVLALAVPLAVVAGLEALVAVASAGTPDRLYVARLAGTALLLETAWAVPLGILLTPVLSSRSSSPGAFVRRAGSVAFGLAVGRSVLFLSANGGLPRLGERQREAAVALGLAVAAAVIAGGARRFLARHPTATGAALAPVLIAGTIFAGWVVLRRWGVLGGGKVSALVWLLAAAVVTVLAGLADRMSDEPVDRRGKGLLAAIPVAAVVAALILRSVGHATLPEIGASAPDRPDVLVVVLDTTRQDHAPAAGDVHADTPNLERLAGEGARFDRAFSTSCWTLPAHASLFTGLMPHGHGATWASNRLADGPATLAERFSRSGWRTAAASANPWITPEFGFDRGFDSFVVGDSDRRPLVGGVTHVAPWLNGVGSDVMLHRDAAGMTLASEALRLLDAGDDERPAFVFLNVLEPHLPYVPDDRFLRDLEDAGWDRASLDAVSQDRLVDLDPDHERAPRDFDGLRRLYGAEVSYVDALVGAMLDRLEDAGRLDSTVVVVTSDHGENLGQHAPLDHQLSLFDTLVHVPLLLRYPDRIPAGSVSDAMVSLVDVHDLILDLAGIEPTGWPGKIVDGPGHDAVLFEYGRPDHILGVIRDGMGLDATPWDRTLRGIRSGNLKWVEASNGRHEAYDLSIDPEERVNLAEAGAPPPPRFAALAARLRVSIPAEPQPPVTPDADPPSEETLERLRSLGYLP